MNRNGSSKLPTLIVMLAAGGIAFGGHRYWQANPEFANSVLDKLGIETTDEEPDDARIETTAELLAEMVDAETTLAACDTSSNEQVVQDAASILTQNLVRILRTPEAERSDAENAEAVRIAHRGLFLAAELDDRKYGNSFVKLNRKLTKDPANAEDEALAKMLAFCHAHSFSDSLTDEATEELQEVCDSLPSERHQTTFVCLVSHKLTTNGKKQNAKALLESCITKIEDRNERARLVGALISQGHRIGPPPTVTQEEFDVMVKLVEKAECRSKFG